jgi:hypothetical protein
LMGGGERGGDKVEEGGDAEGDLSDDGQAGEGGEAADGLADGAPEEGGVSEGDEG